MWDISRATMEECGYKEGIVEDMLKQEETIEEANRARTLHTLEDERAQEEEGKV